MIVGANNGLAAVGVAPGIGANSVYVFKAAWAHPNDPTVAVTRTDIAVAAIRAMSAS